MKRWLVLLLLQLSLTGIRGTARAQAPSASIPHGACEFGVLAHSFDRTLEFTDERNTLNTYGVTSDYWTVLLRMGVTDGLTASMELGGGIGGADIGDYSYVVGGSLQTRVWTHDAVNIATGIGYTRTLYLYPEANVPGGIVVQSTDWNALVEYVFDPERRFAVWAGPTISFMTAQKQAPYEENTYESSQVLGGIVGGRVLFAGHVSLLTQGTWINHIEPMFLLAYRF